jgi:predicted mannosyl-3-phosphoglycerate phosphatase (HAD superfamily)
MGGDVLIIQPFESLIVLIAEVGKVLQNPEGKQCQRVAINSKSPIRYIEVDEPIKEA